MLYRFHKYSYFSDECILERLFLLSKGSVEATKQKIDKLFTSRALIPELALNRNVEEFDTMLDIV